MCRIYIYIQFGIFVYISEILPLKSLRRLVPGDRCGGTKRGSLLSEHIISIIWSCNKYIKHRKKTNKKLSQLIYNEDERMQPHDV